MNLAKAHKQLNPLLKATRRNNLLNGTRCGTLKPFLEVQLQNTTTSSNKPLKGTLNGIL